MTNDSYQPVPDGPLNLLSDDDLMHLVSQGRRDAFEQLVVRYQRMVLGMAIRFLGHRESGLDVTQDVFLSVWAERRHYRAEGKFKSYIASVCVNRCRVVSRTAANRARKNESYRLSLETVDNDEMDAPDTGTGQAERRREILQYLARLKPGCREVLTYRFAHDLSLPQIAELTGMPQGTVKSHLARGLEQIRRALKKGC